MTTVAEPSLEERRAYRDAVIATHDAVMARANVVLANIATLHAPTGMGGHWAPQPYCDGCDSGSCEQHNDPWWPCSTYALVAVGLGVDLPESPWPPDYGL